MKIDQYPILESGHTPEPGKVYTLIESFLQDFEIVNDPFVVSTNESTGLITEARKPGTSENDCMRIRGIYQYENKKNANKRNYPTGLWEKWTANESELMKKVADNRCVGLIEHPKDGVGSIRDSAIKTVKLWMGEKQADGSRPVYGESEVCNTPEGRIVRDLIRSNIKIGVSSRGTGSIKSNGDVDESTYKPETWDVVGNPSTPGAFPNVVTESVKNVKRRVETYQRDGGLEWRILDEATNKEVDRLSANKVSSSRKGVGRMAREQLSSIKRSVEALLATPIVESTNLDQLDGALEEAVINISEATGDDAGLAAAIANPLIARINGKRTKIEEARGAEAVVSAVPAPKPSAKADENDGAESEDELEVEETDDKNADEEVTEAESFAALVQRVTDDPEQAATLLHQAYAELTQMEESLAAAESDLEEAESIMNEQQDENTALLEHITNINETIAVQTTLLQRITASEKEVAEGVAEAIEKAIAANPALVPLAGIMKRFTSIDEVKTLVESVGVKAAATQSEVKKPESTTAIKPLSIGRTRKDLPLSEAAAKPSKEQQKVTPVSETDNSKKSVTVSLSESLIKRRTAKLGAKSLREEMNG